MLWCGRLRGPRCPLAVPRSHQYSVNFPSFVRAFGGEAIEQGSAYSIDGCSGVALWLPPDVHSDEEAIAGLIQRTVSNQRQEEIFALLGQMGGYHPSEPIGLPLIGADGLARQRIRLKVNGARP